MSPLRLLATLLPTLAIACTISSNAALALDTYYLLDIKAKNSRVITKWQATVPGPFSANAWIRWLYSGRRICAVCSLPMRLITIKRARIGLCRRMRRYDEPSNKSAALPPSRSLVDYITNTSGYDFGKDKGRP